ncbi:YidH family protein [Cellulomonas sp. NPDC057328]|uniref:YidH family protein n=1 Tax=Cellulomonas sp. NPDC057328 TaxID=3346101 RepID=UPI00362CE556
MDAPAPRPRRRFPTWVYATGTEPDARFSLANERTFLAWARTALALLAGGVALEALDLPIEPRLRLTAAVLLVALGVLAPVLAWVGWARAERAMRRAEPLPAPSAFGLLVVGVAAAGVLVLVGLVLA